MYKRQVWDYPGDFGRVYVTDAGGNKVPFQITAHGHHYWGHHFTKLLIMAEVPAFGYTTYILRQMDSVPVGNYSLPRDPRSDNHIGDSDQMCIRDSCASWSRTISSNPVSYTHLDVYKRQLSHFLWNSIPARGWGLL